MVLVLFIKQAKLGLKFLNLNVIIKGFIYLEGVQIKKMIKFIF